jgi:hypothetical protein
VFIHSEKQNRVLQFVQILLLLQVKEHNLGTSGEYMFYQGGFTTLAWAQYGYYRKDLLVFL